VPRFSEKVDADWWSGYRAAGGKDVTNNIREPQQARSIEKKNRIIDAAMTQFDEHGYEGTNTKAIAKAAGVSVGTLYAYFTDKKAILMEILMQHLETVDQSVFGMIDQAVMDGCSGREIIRLGLEASRATHTQPPGVLRLMLSMRHTDEDMCRFLESEENTVHARITSLLETLKPRLRITDIEAAVIIVDKALDEIIHTSIINEPSLPQKRIDDALVDMIATYLFTDPDG